MRISLVLFGVASIWFVFLFVDGQELIKLGEANDTSFTSGGMGFVISGNDMVLVDEIIFFQ